MSCLAVDAIHSPIPLCSQLHTQISYLTHSASCYFTCECSDSLPVSVQQYTLLTPHFVVGALVSVTIAHLNMLAHYTK